MAEKYGAPKAPKPLTPEQHVQFIKGVLQASLNSVDDLVAKATKANPAASKAEVVKMVHQHLTTVHIAAAKTQSVSAAEESPLGDAGSCLTAYNNCLAQGGSQANCEAAYIQCMKG